MFDYVDTKCGVKIAASTRSWYADIERITKSATATAVDQGLGALDLARLISKEQGEMEKWRALRIARTEVVGASNQGSYLAADSTGLPMFKVWLSSGAPGPSGFMRDDHEEMGQRGERVPLHEPFIMPDGKDIMFPGDASAPAEHVINCRCSVAYETQVDYIGQMLGETQ
jgi:hypothetical protein